MGLGFIINEKKLISEIKEQKLPEQFSDSIFKNLSEFKIRNIKLTDIMLVTLASVITSNVIKTGKLLKGGRK